MQKKKCLWIIILTKKCLVRNPMFRFTLTVNLNQTSNIVPNVQNQTTASLSAISPCHLSNIERLDLMFCANPCPIVHFQRPYIPWTHFQANTSNIPLGNVMGLQTCDGSQVQVIRVWVQVGRSQPWKNLHPWHGFTNLWQVGGMGQIIIIIIIIVCQI